MTSPAKRDEPGVSPMARLHLWQIQAVRDVLLIAAVIAVVWAGYAIRAVTVPLLVALLLAYLFEPLVCVLVRRFNMSRPVAVSSILVTVGLSVLIVLAIVIPLTIGQTMTFVQDIRDGRFHDSILKLKSVVPEEYHEEFERIVDWVMPGAPPTVEDNQPAEAAPDSAIPPMNAGASGDDDDRLRTIVREEIAAQSSTAPAGPSTQSLIGLVRSGGEAVFGFLGTIVQLGLLAFLIPFYFFFFSVSFPAVTKFCHDLIPINNRPRTLEMIGKMDRAVAGFVRGRIVICLIMGVMLAIGYVIVGVPYPIVLGMVIGAFCLVPYLGGVGIPIAVGLLAFKELNLSEAERMAWWAIILWPTLVYTIVQFIESYGLTPVIAGKATNLDPVTILVAVLAGGSIGGVYGMLLAIPVAACLKILWTDVLLPKIREWSSGKATDPLPM